MISLYRNQHYLNVSLGTQRRTIVNINDSFKTIVKAVGLEKEIKLAADEMAADMIEISKKPKIVDNGAKPLDTSPDVSEWDPFKVVNPEWFARSPFALEDTTDILMTGLILFVITLIILFYVMWSSYYSNAVTSFLIGKKKLPVYHLGLISIAVLMSVFTLSLVYLAAFTGMIVETASMNEVSYEIARLEREIEELRTLVELQSHEEGK